MIIHRLNGCAPTPLAHYLKALGILRIVAEQLDSNARGWWEGERFVLASERTESELLDFWVGRYEPTPLVAPWNKGSGFFANDPVLRPIETSSAGRFGRLREGIRASRQHLDALNAADARVRGIKSETKSKSLSKSQKDALKRSDDYKKRLAESEREFKRLKADLIPDLRLTWRGPHREWMDAALVLDSDGIARFPALLGTGGNDGRLDFTNNFFRRLGELFDFAAADGAPRHQCRTWMREALFGHPARSQSSGIPVGQFAPGGAGGANAALGPDADSHMNPADFVLTLEGAVAFTSAPSRRWDTNAPSRASAPFAVGAHSAGYASASTAESGARGEQWVPLWSAPITLDELVRTLAEGRAQLGPQLAREPLDLARAIGRLGASRGIQAFERFGYIERNGQSNLAVPLGRFVVPDKTSPTLTCLDDLDTWLPRLRRQARDKGAPARLAQAERRLGDAVFAVTQHPNESLRWQTVLLRLSEIESIQITGSGYAAGPIPRLRPEWVRAADDGSPEIRLAVACALQAARFDRSWRPFKGSGVRRHWVTLKNGRFQTSGNVGQQRLQHGNDRVLQGRDGISDAIALITRRAIEASAEGARQLPLLPARSASASIGDLATLISGQVDLSRILSLARALMATDPYAWAKTPCPLSPAGQRHYPDDAWLLVRLATVPYALPNGARVGLDPAIVRRLEAGDASSAISIARRRLEAAGVKSTVRAGNVPAHDARLWAAALAFPISPRTAAQLLARLDPQSIKDTAA